MRSDYKQVFLPTQRWVSLNTPILDEGTFLWKDVFAGGNTTKITYDQEMNIRFVAARLECLFLTTKQTVIVFNIVRWLYCRDEDCPFKRKMVASEDIGRNVVLYSSEKELLAGFLNKIWSPAFLLWNETKKGELSLYFKGNSAVSHSIRFFPTKKIS